jgi:hypothetical protein
MRTAQLITKTLRLVEIVARGSQKEEVRRKKSEGKSQKAEMKTSGMPG